MKSAFWLSLIMSFRFLGLFLVMPLISVYAFNLSSNPLLVGLSASGYALTQILFLYPLGKLSDKIGRKKVIFVGLFIFAFGSLICAISDNIYLLVLGRLLQGAGAISSTVTAFISDLVPLENRSKAMAIFGIFIGLSFVLSMLIGPVLGGAFGIKSLFLLTFVLALLAVLILWLLVEKEQGQMQNKESIKLINVLKDKPFFRLCLFMFFHSFSMSSVFFIIPLAMTRLFGWSSLELYKVFLPAILLGMISMAVAMKVEKNKGAKAVFVPSIVVLAIGAGLGFFANQGLFIAAVFISFVAITAVEPIVQSTATKFTTTSTRGAYLGAFNSFGYTGMLLGGLINASLIKVFDVRFAILFLVFVCIVWFGFSFFITNPPKLKKT